MDHRRRNIKPVLQVIGAAVLFSTGGAAIKTAAFSGLQVASLRSGLAAAMLLVWFGRRAAWSPAAALTGVVYATTLVLFVTATKLTTAANAIFLQSTAPLYIALLGPLLLGERFRVRDLAFLAAVVVGLALCVTAGVETAVTAPDPPTGNLLAAVCGLAWALTLIGLRWGERRRAGTSFAAVIAGNVFACAIGAPALWPLPAAPLAEWATLGYLGIFQIGVAYILLTGAVAHLPALHVSLLLLLEPVLNPVWAWLVRGEEPGARALLGGAIILAASAGQVASDSRPAETPTRG